VGPRNGAKSWPQAWTDPAYKARLLANASAAIAEVGFSDAQGEDMMALENTLTVHNVVVCTLYSGYRWPVLGLPPVWYKSAPYRSRVVLEPRAVLAEFGSRSPRTLKCGFGTRSPSGDTFSCPCVRRARTTWSSLVDLVTREARKDARRRSAARRRSLRPSRRRESNHRRQARAVARNGRRPDVEIEAILSGCGSAQVDVVPARNGLRSPVSAARRSRLQPSQAGANATRRSAVPA
jgi:nitrile hydratase